MGFLKNAVLTKSNNSVIINVNNVGYKISVPDSASKNGIRILKTRLNF